MGNNDACHVLYGMPHSLYTGKVRCYLRKQSIPYREIGTSHPSFAAQIIPKIGRGIIPVVVTPEGTIIQDSIDIIDHFEKQGVPYSAYPTGPLQRVLGILIEYYGSQALLRHAMHYRWSCYEQQAHFLKDAFSTGAGSAVAEKVMMRMQSYLPQLGVNKQSIPAIEESYELLLDVLDAHFAQHPYLFGGIPSIGDYGLIGPLFAHLGRDPVPARIMKIRAPRVFRWVERMTAPNLDVPELPDYEAAYVHGDAVPVTLEPLLRQMSEEMFPELTDKFAFMDAWVAQRQPRDREPVTEKPHQRRLDTVQTHFRGIPIESGVEPYLVYVLRRADRVMDDLDDTDRARVTGYLKKFGLERGLFGKRGYSVGRINNIEVWERA